MSGSALSPLSRLVLFIVCLSIAGSIVAGVHYVAVDLPEQQNVKAPANGAIGPTCGPFYDEDGNDITGQCCDANGHPKVCGA
jgi:hypothetical protein